jgi:hypothetical protein
MFSKFLGRSKQLKPPYKQGGEAQNAKIVFTLSAFAANSLRCKEAQCFHRLGFLLVSLARAEQVQQFRRNVFVMFQ